MSDGSSIDREEDIPCAQMKGEIFQGCENRRENRIKAKSSDPIMCRPFPRQRKQRESREKGTTAGEREEDYLSPTCSVVLSLFFWPIICQRKYINNMYLWHPH